MRSLTLTSRLRWLSPLVGIAFAAGCNDSTGPSKVGSLSFNYSGDMSGSFSVSGEPNLGTNFYPQNAFAAATNFSGSVTIAGVKPRTAPLYDVMAMDLSNSDVTGPRTIDFCSTGGCPEVFFALGFNGDGDTFETSYIFTSGSVTIAAMDDKRMRGSFSGTATYLDPDTGTLVPARTITVTNGQFDVPIRNDLQG